MNVVASSRELDYQWARVTAVSGSAGVVAYVALLALVGLWYLVVFSRLGASSVLLERQHRRSTAALEGSAGPN